MRRSHGGPSTQPEKNDVTCDVNVMWLCDQLCVRKVILMRKVAEIIAGPDAQLSSVLQLQNVCTRHRSIFDIGDMRPFPLDLGRIAFEHSESYEFTWALIDECFVLFTMVGTFLWDKDGFRCVDDLQCVPRGCAKFLNGNSMIIVKSGDSQFRVIALSGWRNVAATEVANVRCFDQLGSAPVIVFVANDMSTALWNFETGSKEVISMNWLSSMNPFRRPSLGDSTALKACDNLIVAASSGRVSVFDTKFALLASIETCRGNAIAIDVMGSTGSVLVSAEDGWKIVNFEIQQVESRVNCVCCGVKDIEVKGELVGFGIVGDGTCMVAERDRLQVVVFADYIAPVVLALTETPDDRVISAESRIGSISFATVKNGVTLLEVAPLDQVKAKVDEQTKLLASCIEAWCRGDIEMCREIAKFCDFSVDVLELCDLRIIQVCGEDMNSLLDALVERVTLHSTFVTMIHELTNIHIDAFALHGYSLVVLITALRWCLASRSSDCNVFAQAFHAGDSSQLINVIRAEFELKQYRWLKLFLLLAEESFKHFQENAELYDTNLRASPDVIELVRATLSQFDLHWSPNFTIDDYRRLCTIGLRIIPDTDESISYIMKIIGTSLDVCERIALETSAYPVLAEILHMSQDISKCKLYTHHLGLDCVEPILSDLLKKGHVADILRIGSIAEWRDVASHLLSFDSLVLAFHYVTENDGDLLQAANLFIQSAKEGTKEHLYTIDQVTTLYSMAKLCCSAAAGEHGELFRAIDNQLMILEIQKSTGIGGNQVMAPNELIDSFLSKKSLLVALCIYTCSFHERTPEANASILADIVAAFAAEAVGIKDSDSQEAVDLVSYLVESNAVVDLPRMFESELSKRIRNKFTVQKIMQMVREAQAILHGR